MKEARFDKPNWINFKSVRLFLHFFVDVDSSKFIFHDCKWNEENKESLNIQNELRHCKHKELVQTCNQLAINYEEKRHFDDSSMFRYAAMETKRLDNKGFRKYLNLYWFYKQTSEYGESWVRAFYWLFLIWIYFALTYWIMGEFQGHKMLSFSESLGYSLQVMTLQKPEPKPFGGYTVLHYGFETILAPLQGALLALAIRRKFMR